MILRRRYLAWWTIEDVGKTGLGVFEWVPKNWRTGITTFVPKFAEYAEKQRAEGKLVWTRE